MLIALIIVFTALSQVNSQCPTVQSPCICESTQYEPVVIQCSNSGSLANTVYLIRKATSVLIDSLIIKYTPIPKLPAGIFQNFRIKRLVLNKNQMTEIDANAFNGLPLETISELDLKDNKLRGIPQTGVNKLKNLQKLYLSRNAIRSLQSNAFLSYESRKSIEKLDISDNLLLDSGLSDPSGRSTLADLVFLKELSLESNSLTTMPSGLLVAQRETLTNLNLASNNIKMITRDQLDFPNLESLSLQYCDITDLPSSAFRNVPKLKYLYLTGNKFSVWNSDLFKYIGNLEILAIGETPIQIIPTEAFINIPRLNELKMSESAVIEIQKGAFQRIPNVQGITLDKNRLRRVTADTFQGLTKLKTLNLYSNFIDFVENFAWANLPALRHLDLSFNNLSVLNSGTFQNTFTSSDSRMLYLCGNPWACDSRIDWLRSWLNANPAIKIDKPGSPRCQATCATGPYWLPKNWPIRERDPPPPFTGANNDQPGTLGTSPPQSLPTPGADIVAERAGELSATVWIILGIILGILLLSILLLLLVRYFVARRRKRDKQEEELRRMLNSSNSSYFQASLPRSQFSTGVDLTTDRVDLNLPRASTIEVNDHYIGY